MFRGDSLTAEQDIENDLSDWLRQLDFTGQTASESVSSKQKQHGQNHKSSQNIKHTDSTEIDFDAILGDLCELELEINQQQSGIKSSTLDRKQFASTSQNGSRTKTDSKSIRKDSETSLQGTPNELNTFVATEHLSGKDAAWNKSRTNELRRRPSGSSSGSLPNHYRTTTDTVKAAESVVSKDQSKTNSLQPAKSAPICLHVHTPTGCNKGVLADELMTAGQLCVIVNSNQHPQCLMTWAIVEQLPDLYMERLLEDHVTVVDEVKYWLKDSRNRLLTAETKNKYTMFMNQQDTLLAHLEGQLYMKSESAKLWKKFDFFLTSSSGLSYHPKGKAKASKTESVCLDKLENVDIYTGVEWKKKYKAPTEFGFALKAPKIQAKAPKYIRYLCAEDKATLCRWVTGLRLAKFGHQLHNNYILAAHSEDNPTSQRQSAGYAQEVSGSTSQKSEQTLTRNDESDVEASALVQRTSRRKDSIPKLVPMLPIMMNNTRIISNQPQQNSIGTLTRSSTKAVYDEITPNQSFPPPPRCPSSEISTRPVSGGNSLNPEMSDLPPPPREFFDPPSDDGSGQSKAPPSVPRRDNKTKLSFKSGGEHQQTKVFILNLDRVITLKKKRGSQAVNNLEQPLPPPPKPSFGVTTYLDLDELPPPPAELLEGLKLIRNLPGTRYA